MSVEIEHRSLQWGGTGIERPTPALEGQTNLGASRPILVLPASGHFSKCYACPDVVCYCVQVGTKKTQEQDGDRPKRSRTGLRSLHEADGYVVARRVLLARRERVRARARHGRGARVPGPHGRIDPGALVGREGFTVGSSQRVAPAAPCATLVAAAFQT
jgi:hypothetical protein